MCDTLVVVQPGRVLFAKSSDRDPNEGQALEWHPATRHPPGARLRCTWVTIPQVAHTHAVLLSRPFWGWGAEMGANEHGVTIGNEAVFTRLPVPRVGLTGMDLLRLALERAASAAEAVDVLATLIEEVGQGGGGGYEDRGFRYHNSFLVADPHGAFLLESAGRHFAVAPVRGARTISNGLTLPGFAERYRDPLRTAVAKATARRSCTAAYAASATGVGDLMAALRDHGGATPSRRATDRPAPPRYDLLTGSLGAPCVHGGGLLAASQTTASWVAELRPGGARHWVTATAAPCTGIFKPMRVEEPLALGPPPGDRFDPAALWWRHERLHRLALRDPERTQPIIAAERDDLEAAWRETPPAPAVAFAEAEAWEERTLGALRRLAPRDRRPPFVRRYWRIRDRRAGMPP